MRSQYLFVIVLGILVLILAVVGFIAAGFPISQQLIQLDQMRAYHFQSISYRIEAYFRTNDQLPESLKMLPAPLEIKDPLSKNAYEYAITSPITYKLCTDFALNTTDEKYSIYFRYTEQNKNSYIHKKGKNCITYKLPDYLKNSYNSNLFVSPTPTPIPKLVGYWKLEELNPAYGVFDSVPRKNDGIIGSVKSVEGKVGNAASFSGTNESYIDVTNNPDIKKITGDFTLSLWAYRLDNGSRALATTNNNNDGGFGMFVGNSGEIYCRTSFRESSDPFALSYIDSYTEYASGDLLANNGWHYLSIVRKNNKCNIYVDAVDKTFTRGYHTKMVSSNNPLTIGGKPSHTSEMFNGYIDEVKIYNYARTADQIKEDMNY